MTLLAIDTASQSLSLALHDGETLLADCAMQVGRGHNQALAPLIEQLMARTGLQMPQLQALAVAVGPGSYTGVRIGVALAKGMAAARGLPLIGVTTLEALVAAAPQPQDEPRDLLATLPAGRNRIICATYAWAGGVWRQDRKARTATWQEALADCARPMQVTGEIGAAGLAEVRAAGHVVLPAPIRLRRAGWLAEIAWRRLRTQGAAAFPAERVAPVYLQSP